jgi:preprotein translocase subunit SecG
MSILINVLLTIWSIVALLMVLVVLMQRPKSEGLGAAFGGAVTENIFGAQTTNVLVKFTGWLAGIFFVLTFSLSILYARKTSGDSALRRELLKQQTGAATTSPSPSAAPTAAAAQTSPVASAAPDSGVGVVPAGSVAPPAAPASAPTESVAPSPEQSAAATTPRPSKRKRKP